jgi:hypothetical protein
MGIKLSCLKRNNDDKKNSIIKEVDNIFNEDLTYIHPNIKLVMDHNSYYELKNSRKTIYKKN